MNENDKKKECCYGVVYLDGMKETGLTEEQSRWRSGAWDARLHPSVSVGLLAFTHPPAQQAACRKLARHVERSARTSKSVPHVFGGRVFQRVDWDRA